MKTRSAKAKGRRLVQQLKETLLAYAPDLSPDDIYSPTTSQPGRDLFFSPRAQSIYNYAVECKNVEKLNVWDAYAQAKTHVKNEDEIPLVVYSKNRSEVMVTLSLEHFLKLTR